MAHSAGFWGQSGVFLRHSGESETGDPGRVIKGMLRDPSRDIDLNDYVGVVEQIAVRLSQLTPPMLLSPFDTLRTPDRKLRRLGGNWPSTCAATFSPRS